MDAEEFVQLPAPDRAMVFPMRWLFSKNGTDLLNFRTGVQAHPNAAIYQPRLDALAATFIRYRLPVVLLKELSVEEVCPIFERINSSGTKLSIFDLMVAATWTPSFDLNDISSKIATQLDAKDFEKIEPNTVLKCLAAVKSDGLKRSQMLALRELDEADMKALVDQTTAAILRAVDILHTEFKVYSWDFLPYEAVLIVLCYVCSKVDTMNPTHVIRLRQWFWRSAFSERYRVGGESFVTRDLERVTQFVLDGKRPEEFGQSPAPEQVIDTEFRSGNSRSRAFILALAKTGPRNLTNGSAIDASVALSQFNRKQFHHIFPQAYLRRVGNGKKANSLANICMLAASENNAISDDDPHEYLPRLAVAQSGNAEDIFMSNLMPSPATLDYAGATFDEFLAARAKFAANQLYQLCEGKV